MQIRWRFHGGLFFLSKKWTHFKLPTGFEAIMDKLVFYSNTEFTARFNTCLHAVTKSNSFFLKRRIKADEWLVGKHRLFLEQSFMKDRCEATWTEFQWSSFCGERSKTIIWKYLWDSRNNFILDVVLYKLKTTDQNFATRIHWKRGRVWKWCFSWIEFRIVNKM